MKKLSESVRFKSWFERIYKIGVAVKGFDGLVELVVGVALLISPSLVHMVLKTIAGELGEHHSHTIRFITDYVARLDGELARSGLAFLIFFLILHGIVKLTLVYCLLKEIVRAYPYALAILGLFLVYQLYVFIVTPTIGMALFTILDAIIIWLVWHEYRELLGKK